jgi:nucleotide sugar dehydrogenase
MNKNITIIGVGKLGLCLALNLERKGYNITGVDLDSNYINELNSKTFISSEPLVTELLVKSKNISFTTDLEKSLENDIIFIVVQTPSTPEFKYDHSRIESICDNLKKLGKQTKRKDLIINCTTFPGYCEDLNSRLNEYNYHVSYNPEFIAQGSIIKDQLNCDLVLIGQSDDIAGKIIENIYSVLCESNPIVKRMTRTEAEICKLSINCFLTTKISFANMIGDICSRMNCDPSIVLSAVGSDSRIGNKYLNYGFGFGGPCFPRDNRALTKCAEEVGINAVISKSTDLMNELHLKYQLEYFKKNNQDKSKTITLEYVTYKKESTSLEESQQFEFYKKLKEMDYKVEILDNRPEVINELTKKINDHYK